MTARCSKQDCNRVTGQPCRLCGANLIPGDAAEPAGKSFADAAHETLRDHFAGQALPALIPHFHDKGSDQVAWIAYEYADSMMAERAKRKFDE